MKGLPFLLKMGYILKREGFAWNSGLSPLPICQFEYPGEVGGNLPFSAVTKTWSIAHARVLHTVDS